MSKERAVINCRKCSSIRGKNISSFFEFKDAAMKALEEERNFKLHEKRCADYSVPAYISKALTQCYASCNGSTPKIANTINDYILRSK